MHASPQEGAVLSAGLDTGTQAGRERVRLAIENFGLAFFETDLVAGQLTVTPNAYSMFGLPYPGRSPVNSSPFWECYHPDDKEWAQRTFEADLRGERGRDSYCERVRIIRRNDNRQRRIEFSGRMFGRPGERTHIVGMLRDVTEIAEAEERQELLLRDVNHRANNNLAVVQALIRLSRGKSVMDYRDALEGRVLSLARTQTLLQRSRGQRATVTEVIDAELSAYRAATDVRVSRVPPLRNEAVQPIAMILHELATNAYRHGAFSRPGGRVGLEVAAQRSDVVLAWVERGGPPIEAAPIERGTGFSVIQAQIRRMHGSLELDWQRAGLGVLLRFDRKKWGD